MVWLGEVKIKERTLKLGPTVPVDKHPLLTIVVTYTTGLGSLRVKSVQGRSSVLERN